MNKKYVISQIYLPFFRKIIENEPNKDFIVLVCNLMEYIIAVLLKLRTGRKITVIKLSSTGELAEDQILESVRGQTVFKSNVIDYLKKSGNKIIALQWNGLEYIERSIRKLCHESIIMENGYFRPNSITIDSEFLRNAPLGLRNNYTSNNLLDDFDKKTIYLSYKQFDRLSILDILYRVFRSKAGIRPRKKYIRSASIAKKYINIFRRNKINHIPNLSNAIVYYGQVADDSSLILDQNYRSLNKYLEKLYEWGNLKDLKLVYRPHPLELNDPLLNWFLSKGCYIDRSEDYLRLLAAPVHATFSSTVGFELVQRGVPLIILGDPFYINGPGVYNIKNLDTTEMLVVPNSSETLEFINRCKRNHIIFDVF